MRVWNKTVGVWLFEFSYGSCSIVRLHNNGSGEETHRMWHQRYDDLKDLQYGLNLVVKEMDEEHEEKQQDRYAHKLREAHRDN